MIAELIFSLSAMACKGDELSPLVLLADKSYRVKAETVQEIILDGKDQLPKIKSIKGTTGKGKPMLTVTSGLQVLEGGQMKSYPYRISLKMNEIEKDWDRPVEVLFEGGGKPNSLKIQWFHSEGGCATAVAK